MVRAAVRTKNLVMALFPPELISNGFESTFFGGSPSRRSAGRGRTLRAESEYSWHLLGRGRREARHPGPPAVKRHAQRSRGGEGEQAGAGQGEGDEQSQPAVGGNLREGQQTEAEG